MLAAFCAVSIITTTSVQELPAHAVCAGKTVVVGNVFANVLEGDEGVEQGVKQRKLGRIRRAYEMASQTGDPIAPLPALCAVPKSLGLSYFPHAVGARVIPVLAPMSRRGPPSFLLA